VPPPERRPRRDSRESRDTREGAHKPRDNAVRRPRPDERTRDRDRNQPQRPPREEDPRRPRIREPELPPDLPFAELDRAAKAELRSLPESLAEKVSQHLVAAGLLLDEDAEAAHRHAAYARSIAPRLAVVREAAGLTAYRIGDYAAALAELRAVRRMTGDPSHLPILADAERGLGRPDRALAFGKDPDITKLDPGARVELAIVLSGARRDRAEFDAAVVGLQGSALDSDELHPWTPRLWYAYAEALLAAGRRDEAIKWFESVAAIDEEGETDADDRVAELTAN
jgi:tetratricopeptide (TPR) repeat protein